MEVNFLTWERAFSENLTAAAAAAALLQSCPTLCDPIDGSPLGSPVPGILQARTLEWVAFSFSSAWKWKWSCSVVSDPQRPHGLQRTRLLCPWDFPGKSTRVGCHCLLQALFSKPLKMLRIKFLLCDFRNVSLKNKISKFFSMLKASLYFSKQDNNIKFILT